MSDSAFKKNWIDGSEISSGYPTISLFLEQILKGNIETKSSLGSQLQTFVEIVLEIKIDNQP